MLVAVAMGMMMVSAAAPPLPPIQTALTSIGFVQLQLSDLKDTPEYPKRLSNPTGFLAVSGSFKGDGVDDQAWILKNVQRGVAYVIVSSIREKADTYVIKKVPLADADDIGLRLASPASGRGYGLTVFSFSNATTETFDLIGDDFVRRIAK